MKVLLIVISILIIGCSIDKKETTDASTHFGELPQDKQLERLGELSDELKGDFLMYSGQMRIKDVKGLETLDSTSTFIQLVLDTNHRFAVRMKFIETEIITDTMMFFTMPGLSNKGIGNWSDLGDKFELKFKLGTVDSFFDEENNKGKIEIIDNYTLHLDKSIDEIWISKTLCRK